MTKKALLSWSGGKDSALALRAVCEGSDFHIEALLTTVTAGYDRISMHGVRRELLEAQCRSIALPLEQIDIPQDCSHEEYDRLMRETLDTYQSRGVSHVIFGDLFLEDIRAYRERRLAEAGLKGVFPLWGRDTTALAEQFLHAGFEAIVVCVDTDQLDGSFVGRHYDRSLLDELPKGVDPCGEHGEFHTFVYGGPIFQHRLNLVPGKKVLREDRFHFCDLLPQETSAG